MSLVSIQMYLEPKSLASLARTSLGVVQLWWMSSDSLSKLVYN